MACRTGTEPHIPCESHDVMSAIPRYRPAEGPVVLSAGFRPFFLAAALWAAIAIPAWVVVFTGSAALPTALSPSVWHVHEMVFGFGAAVVAGFLLTAIPNWTGRLPLQGGPLAGLVLLWLAGRVAVLLSQDIGAGFASVLDLAFPLAFLAVVSREIIAGRNWRNLPMVTALSLLFLANLLVHLEATHLTTTAAAGNRLGVATLVMLISFVGGRIIPSFTRNWLVKQRPAGPLPAPFDGFDRAALGLTAVVLAIWVVMPEAAVAPWCDLAAGTALCVRLLRWQGIATWREPLLWILHLAYAWLGVGFLLLGLDAFLPWLPPTAALHALTAGAIGTATLAVMIRVTLGHTGRPLIAGPGTTAVYGLVTLAAVLRLLAPLAGAQYVLVLSLAGVAWSAAFGLFAGLYFGPLTRPRPRSGEAMRPI